MRTLLILTAVSLSSAGVARAHPCFVGTYTASLPCPGVGTYEFGPAEFVGAGVWVGCLRHTVAGQPVSLGTYELRMWSGTEGTVSIREGQGISTAVGVVDLGARTVDYLGTMYRR